MTCPIFEIGPNAAVVIGVIAVLEAFRTWSKHTMRMEMRRSEDDG